MRYGHSRRWFVGAVAALAGLATVGTTMVGGLSETASAATAAATAGCGKAPTLTAGSHTIQSSGTNRTYIVRLPDNYDRNHPYRLLFGFHWNGGTANDVDSGGTSGYPWSYYGLRALSGNGAIFVAPQGLGNGWANSNGQDLTFVDDMVKQIEAGLCVDSTQLFSLGFSYGGGMSYAIACARATVFRAVAVYSGGQLSGCSGGTQPIAYMGLHGLRDPVLNISAGRSLRDRFVRNNGCTSQNPPEPAQGSLTHVITTYSGCRAGYPVTWAAFDAGHTPNPWDGSAGDYNPGEKSWTGPAVWAFFSQFQSTTSPSPSPTSPSPTSPSPTSPSPTSPSPTTSPVGGACAASYRTVNSWAGGFQGEVTVTAGGSAINGWTVRWTLGSGQSITQIWNGTLQTSGSSVAVGNMSYNGSLAASASTTFGFLGAGTASTPAFTCTSP